MSEIKVEKGIPLPNGKRHNGGKYPWKTMEIGDSFLFDAGLKDNSAYMAARQATRANPERKFKAYSTEDGIRCWRIA